MLGFNILNDIYIKTKMSKIKITQKQYNAILLHEQKIRTSLIKEDVKKNLLAISLLAGIGLTGQNERIANDTIKHSENMDSIKDTLEDDLKIKELVDGLTEKGLKNPENFLAKNADKIIKKFNEISEKEGFKSKLDFVALSNLKNLDEN